MNQWPIFLAFLVLLSHSAEGRARYKRGDDPASSSVEPGSTGAPPASSDAPSSGAPAASSDAPPVASSGAPAASSSDAPPVASSGAPAAASSDAGHSSPDVVSATAAAGSDSPSPASPSVDASTNGNPAPAALLRVAGPSNLVDSNVKGGDFGQFGNKQIQQHGHVDFKKTFQDTRQKPNVAQEQYAVNKLIDQNSAYAKILYKKVENMAQNMHRNNFIMLGDLFSNFRNVLNNVGNVNLGSPASPGKLPGRGQLDPPNKFGTIG